MYRNIIFQLCRVESLDFILFDFYKYVYFEVVFFFIKVNYICGDSSWLIVKGEIIENYLSNLESCKFQEIYLYVLVW